MQPSLFHRLKNKRPSLSLIPDNNYNHVELLNTLYTDLYLLFTTRPIYYCRVDQKAAQATILNYGVEVVDNTELQGDKETIGKLTAENILYAINNFEKRLRNVRVEKEKITADKIAFKVTALFNVKIISFVVTWEISVASYSLDLY